MYHHPILYGIIIICTENGFILLFINYQLKTFEDLTIHSDSKNKNSKVHIVDFKLIMPTLGS